MFEIFKLFGKVTIDSEGADKDIESIDKKGKKTGVTLNDMAEKATKAGKAIAVGMVAAGAAIGGLALKASNAAFEINKFSQITGTTTEEFQEWDFVLKSVGHSMEAAAGDFAMLGEKAMDAANGVGEGAELFGMLGVRVKGAGGQLKSQGEIFEETIKRLQRMEDVTKRNAIASALLGTTGEELVPILNMTNRELEQMRGNAVIIEDAELQKAQQFRDTLTRLSEIMNKFVVTLGIEVMPIVMEFAKILEDNSETIGTVLAGAIRFLAVTVGFLVNNLNVLLPLILGVVSAFTAMKIIGVVTALMNAYKASALAATVAQSGLNAAMLANPIGLIIIGIGALIAILTLLVLNFDKIKAAFESTMKFIVKGITFVVESYVNAYKAIYEAIQNIKNAVRESFINLFNSIAQIGRRIFDVALGSIKAFVNSIFGFINSMAERIEKLLNFKLPDFLGGQDIGIKLPRIPMLFNGASNIGVGGIAAINEFEPEFVNLPSGATVTPMSRMKEIPGFGDSGTNFNAPVNINISAKDLKEFNDAVEFFKAVSRMRGAY